jgi:uncharacterized protein YqeY
MASEADIQRDLTAAMKARSMEELNVLRGLVAAIKNLKVEKMVKELGETEIVQLVRKEVNKRSEAITFAKQGGREELVQENERQKAVLERYLPKQLTAEQLEQTIAALAAELGTTSIGPLMAKLRERHAGEFDGQTASALIRKLAAPGS